MDESDARETTCVSPNTSVRPGTPSTTFSCSLLFDVSCSCVRNASYLFCASSCLKGLILTQAAEHMFVGGEQPMAFAFVVSDIQEIRPIVRVSHVKPVSRAATSPRHIFSGQQRNASCGWQLATQEVRHRKLSREVAKASASGNVALLFLARESFDETRMPSTNSLILSVPRGLTGVSQQLSLVRKNTFHAIVNTRSLLVFCNR